MVPRARFALPCMPRASALLVALTIMSSSTTAEADHKAAARARFEAGKKAYEAGEYRAAIAAFKAAMKLHPSPLLVYNIARCHEKLGEWEEAARVYRGYLRQFPEAPDRLAVAARVRELEEVARQLGRQRPPPMGRAAPPPAPSASPRATSPAAVPTATTAAQPGDRDAGWRPPAYAAWVSLGVAVVAAGTGTYFGVRSMDRNASDEAAVSSARGATVSFSVAGVAAAIAGGALLWRLFTGKRSRSPAMGLGPGRAFVLLGF